MVRFAKFTKEDREIVKAIVDRAIATQIYEDPLTVEMDISATHSICPLRLGELSKADDFNFSHDLYGIQRHLNRRTGKLEGSFLPRFAHSDVD